ncbi:MAG: ATP-binding protein [Pyrinomonadaceae bacterium]
MPTTIEELEEWMQVPKETEGLEFKAAKNGYNGEKFLDYCLAIANERGGKLILGVTDKPPRTVCGTPAVNDTGGMQEKVFNTLHFDVRIEVLNHPDGRVVICHIPSRPVATPLQRDGRYLTRSGESTRGMTTERLREIMDEGKPDWLSRIAREGCSASDVISLLDTETYFKRLADPYPATQGRVLERLEDDKLIFDDTAGFSITNLGAVLFARALDEFEGLRRKAPRVLIYEGSDKISDTGLDVPGTKGYVVGFQPLINFINSHIPSDTVIGRAFRTEVKMFPEEAIRELVANALIHQDFNETGTSVTIEIYSNRIEISNPGTPLIAPDRFADGVQSRNEILAGLARRLGMCEEQGLGIDRVINSIEVHQLPAPEFRVGERSFTAVLFAQKKFEEMDRQERINACFWHCVLRYVTHKKMNNTSLRERFSLPDSRAETASRIINDTIHEKRIKSDDPTRVSKKLAGYVPYWA